MTDTCNSPHRDARHLLAALVAVTLLSNAPPAEAGWIPKPGATVAGGLVAGGFAWSMKKNIGEATDQVGELLNAFLREDADEVNRISGSFERLGGKIGMDASPLLSIGAGALDGARVVGEKINKRLNAAKRVLGRLAGKAGDARAALAIDSDERPLYESNRVLGKARLPAVTVSRTRQAPDPYPSSLAEAWGMDAETIRRSRDPAAYAGKADPWAQDAGQGWDSPPAAPVATRTDAWSDDAGEGEQSRRAGASIAGADPWGQEPKEEEMGTGDAGPWGEDGRAGREGGDVATGRLQGEYAAALDRFLGAEEGSSDYEATLSALLEREKELLAGVAGQEEQELTPDERRRVQACLAEREFDPGASDGIFGPRTRTAIRAWQTARGREESGRLDQSSARTLLEECEVAVAEADTETTTESVEQIFEPKCDVIFGGQSWVPYYKLDEWYMELVEKTEACYIEFVDKPGCHLALNKRMKLIGGLSGIYITHFDNWNWFLNEGTVRLRWSGGCSGGVPNGHGILSEERPSGADAYWSRINRKRKDWSRKYTGRFVDGVPQGKWNLVQQESNEYSAYQKERYEIHYSMVHGQIHGEIIKILDFGFARSGPPYYMVFRASCEIWTGKIENGKFHERKSRNC